MGAGIALAKTFLPVQRLRLSGGPLPHGISVVIPSRNGRELLARLMPLLDRELRGIESEVIVVDNGSQDGTAAWLQASYPQVRVELSGAPLSFARAVNRGITTACFDRICLLNNDMEPHPGFFGPLLDAFDQVPDLFCATAQIHFPDGQRREETGKAVMRPPGSPPQDTSFPVYCAEPVPGENLSYVLYGSGGCSVYDARKLRALGNVGEIYEPAYVEDLDLGVRGWQAGWPTVFVAPAEVTHRHRATTSRYYSAAELDRVLEVNYLRFLARAVGSPALFRRLWSEAVTRLSRKGALEQHEPSLAALRQAWHALRWMERPIAPARDELVLAIGSGDVAVFPGRGQRTGAIALMVTRQMPSAARVAQAHPGSAQVIVTSVEELHTPPSALLEVCAEVVQVRRSGSEDSFRAALDQTIRKWKPSVIERDQE